MVVVIGGRVVVVIGGRVIVVVVPRVKSQFEGSGENADCPSPSVHSTSHSYVPAGMSDTIKILVLPLDIL